MDGVEFRCLRRSLGVDVRWLAGHFDVAERTVSRWEHNTVPVPDKVAGDIRELASWASARVVELLRTVDKGLTRLTVPSMESAGYPPAWHEAIAGRVASARDIEIRGSSTSERRQAERVAELSSRHDRWLRQSTPDSWLITSRNERGREMLIAEVIRPHGHEQWASAKWMGAHGSTRHDDIDADIPPDEYLVFGTYHNVDEAFADYLERLDADSQEPWIDLLPLP